MHIPKLTLDANNSQVSNRN